MEHELEKQWNYNQAAETEQKFREFLTETLDNNARAEVLTQIARAQGLQGKFDEAHKTLNEVEVLAKDERVKVRYLLERGRVFNSSNQRDKTSQLFLEAYDLAKSIGADFYTIDAAHMLAIVEPAEKQLHWYEVCLELCETSKDERAKRWFGSISNNAAWTYHDLGMYEKALETFQKALAWHEANGKLDTIRIARWSVARALRSLGKYQDALDIQHKLLREEQNDGYIYEELGECLLTLKKDNEAEPYFAKAYELLSQDSWFVRNESARLERLKTLSSGYSST
jgi:tetratricopeptide (TPR) repeat protein